MPSPVVDSQTTHATDGAHPSGGRRSPRWLTTVDTAYTDTALRARLLGGRLMTRPWEWIVIGAITLLAGLLRFPRLDHPHKLIFDETYYVKDAFSLLMYGVEMQWPDDINDQFVAGNAEPSADNPAYVVHPPLGKWMISLGMALFGTDNGYGWRFSSALVGTASVFLVAVIAWYIFRSSTLGATAGLLLAIEGHHIVMSRTALLDIFLSFFVLAAFGALLLDRRHGRSQLATKLAETHRNGTLKQTLEWGPWILWRPWRLVAGVLLGAACAVKLSGLAFMAILGIITVLWDMNARRTVGVRRWFLGGALYDGPLAFVSIVILGGVTYLMTWMGWILSPRGYYRNWAAENPAESGIGTILPEWFRSLVHYHRQSTQFHTGLESGHNYASSPWTWPFMGRPVSMHYESSQDGSMECGADHCSEAILDIANPVIWWAGTVAIVVLAVMWFLRRDWRIGSILGIYVAGQLVWALWPERTMFFFYTIAYTPFLILAITYCLGMLLRINTDRDSTAWRFNAIVVAVFLLIATVTSAFFMPLWTGEPIPYESWRLRMWIQSWI